MPCACFVLNSSALQFIPTTVLAIRSDGLRLRPRSARCMGGFDIRRHSRNTRGKSPDAGVEAQVVCRYETRQGNGVETIQW